MFMKKIKSQIITTLFAFILLTNAVAQESTDHIKPAQITFFSPLGTNGQASAKTMNHFSLNMLYGTSAGVFGCELGGLVNVTNGPVSGLQMAGLGNFTSGEIVGAQLSGLINTNSSSLRGLQMAGLINTIKSNNENSDRIASSSGAQFSGLINIHEPAMKGFQMAGLANIQQGDFNGVQMSGLLNKANNISGVQFGIINIADTVKKGIPIGLLNFIKDGYMAVEVESNESFYSNINFKTGISRFYSIWSLSYEEQNGRNYWATGFGFGGLMPVSHRMAVNIDAISYQVNEDEWWTDELNSLNKLKVNASYQLMPNLAIYGGMSVNVFVTQLKDHENDQSRFKFPDTFYKDQSGKTDVYIYPGFNAGLRF